MSSHVVVFGLSVFVLLSPGCKRKGPLGPASSDLALLPAEASTLLRVNVADAKASAAWLPLLALIEEQRLELARDCGLDLHTNVDAVTVGFDGSAFLLGLGPARDFGAIVTARFDKTKLRACLADADGAPTPTFVHQGVTVLGGDDRPYFAFLGSTRLGIGSRAWITRMVELSRRPGKCAGDRPEVQGLSTRILKRIEFHYTPKHASWLNMVEIEISVLNEQCLDRRLPDMATLNSKERLPRGSRNGTGSGAPFAGSSPSKRPARSSRATTHHLPCDEVLARQRFRRPDGSRSRAPSSSRAVTPKTTSSGSATATEKALLPSAATAGDPTRRIRQRPIRLRGGGSITCGPAIARVSGVERWWSPTTSFNADRRQYQIRRCELAGRRRG